jgi:hypothetical protein
LDFVVLGFFFNDWIVVDDVFPFRAGIVKREIGKAVKVSMSLLISSVDAVSQCVFFGPAIADV